MEDGMSKDNKFQAELRETLLQIKKESEAMGMLEGPAPYRRNRPAYREGFIDALTEVGLKAGIHL